MLSDRVCSFVQDIHANLDAPLSLRIARGIMCCTPNTAGSIHHSELRRPDAPIAAGLSRHYVKMIMRYFLSAKDTVVLKCQNAQRLIPADQRDSNPPGRPDDGGCLAFIQVQESANMPFGYHTALPNFVLRWIDHGNCAGTFIYDRPRWIASGKTLAKLAWMLRRKLDHIWLQEALNFHLGP